MRYPGGELSVIQTDRQKTPPAGRLTDGVRSDQTRSDYA